MKKNETRRRLVLIAALALLPAICPLLRAEEAPEAAVAAARAGLRPMLERIPGGDLARYGFSSAEAMDGAGLGRPYRLRVITQESLAAYAEGDGLDSLATPTGAWYFPVMAAGRETCILTVGEVEGSWQAVGIGKAALAREMGKVARQWPGNGGETPCLIAVLPAHSYFFSVADGAGENLTPLSFEGRDGEGKLAGDAAAYSSLDSLAKTIGRIRSSGEEN